MGRILHVLIVEDSENDALLLLRELRKGGYQPEYKRVDTEIAMVEALKKDKWDIIISDYSMPQFNGLAALKISQRYKADIPFIIVSGTIGEDIAVEAMKAGAHDYLMKGNLERLTPAIERELHDAQIRREHKLSLIKLRQTEGIVESSHDMMALLDKNFVCIYANDAYLKAFGKTRDQFWGQSAQDVFGEVVFKTTIKPHADRCFEGEKARYQEWFDFPILGHRYLDVAYTPYIGDTNVVNEFVIIARDITELKQAEANLKEAILQQNITIRAGNIGLWDWDLITNKVSYSAEWKRQIGYEDHEIRDNFDEWKSRIHPDDLESEIESVQKSIASLEQDHKAEFRFRHKDGSYRWILAQASILQDESGQAIKMLGSHVDISERKKAEADKLQLEKQLQQAQKMESIGTLAGGIAHDFNNILSAVIGYTELALGGIEKGTELDDDLQEVRKAGMRAKDLVKQILTFARQSNEAAMPIQINIIAKEVLKFIKSSIPSTIQINNKIYSDSLIMGSSTQIHQVLMNLCTNAAQSMEEKGGMLEVSVNDTTIDKMSMIPNLRPGEYIEIKVSDTGMGIAPQNLHTIFEPYFTTKPVGEGTGLGLAVVHGIVENYGGQITVDSTIGKGTCFTIYLPISKKRKVYTPSEREDLPLGNENILFVDDEAPIAKMGSKILEQLGYTVTKRTSSLEALELFRSKPQTFDLVISDMTMPNMTGDKLAIELMKVRSDIPVVLCTGYSKKISEESVADIGIKALFYKPVVKADLAKTVRKVLDKTNSSD